MAPRALETLDVVLRHTSHDAESARDTGSAAHITSRHVIGWVYCIWQQDCMVLSVRRTLDMLAVLRTLDRSVLGGLRVLGGLDRSVRAHITQV